MALALALAFDSSPDPNLLSISLTDKTPLKKFFNKSNFSLDKELELSSWRETAL